MHVFARHVHACMHVCMVFENQPNREEPRKSLDEVLREVRDTVLRCTIDSGGHGVLSSAFKAAYYKHQRHELQLTFDSDGACMRLRVKDLMDMSPDHVTVETLKTQPVYKYKGGLKAALAAAAAAGTRSSA